MTVSALAVQLTLREKVAAPNAYSWAWRIQNEYPESLRLAAEAWAEEKELPEVSITEITLAEVAYIPSTKIPLTHGGAKRNSRFRWIYPQSNRLPSNSDG